MLCSLQPSFDVINRIIQRATGEAGLPRSCNIKSTILLGVIPGIRMQLRREAACESTTQDEPLMYTDSCSALRHADSPRNRIDRACGIALRLCVGVSLISFGMTHHPDARAVIVGEAGMGGAGGAPNGGRGGDGEDGFTALDLTTSYTTHDDIEGAPGGGGGGGGGGSAHENAPR